MVKLDNFCLEEYNSHNQDHKTVIIELCNDPFGQLYLGDLEYQTEEDIHSYIVYYGKSDEPVGYISLTVKEERYEISYGDRPKFRGQHLGALLLQEFSEALFERYPEIDTLTLIINNLNTSSKKTADLAGYIKETSVRHVQHRM